MSKNLFKVLEGILQSGCESDILASTDEIIAYAEVSGDVVEVNDAIKIIDVGKQWLDDIENGNGEWSRMRHEAIAALEA